jgi:predicted permease
LEIEGRAGDPRFVSTVTISSRFFEAVRRPLDRGRIFQDLDGSAGHESAIINQRLASQFFPGEDPLGKRLRLREAGSTPERPAGPEAPWRTIVGVSPSIRHGSPQDAYSNAVVYRPYREDSRRAMTLLVRSSMPAGSVMDAVRREVQAIDRDQPVSAIQTLEQRMAEERWPIRVFGGAFVGFALIGLVLSAVGLYAVMAYAVRQRTQEIGIRMAVGAQPRQVSWLILKRGLMQLAIGLSLGLVGGLFLSQALRAVLVDVTPTDPLTFASITILLALVSVAACLLPARRATRVDPVVALRAE